jgi:cob(I)alamin adenosyltransferase
MTSSRSDGVSTLVGTSGSVPEAARRRRGRRSIVVRLDRIYTRGGDSGMTSLGDGTRVRKTHPRIAAYGTVDELNAILGVVQLQRGLGARAKRLLAAVQNDLFDVGADLCVPRPADEAPGARLRVTTAQVETLERAIDAYTAHLQPLRSFVLPGGGAAAAWLHAARVVCRRAEVQVAVLAEREPDALGPQSLVYLNRLSDLLFVMARWANDRGRADVVWRPGAGGGESGATLARRGAATAGRKRRERTPSKRRSQ